jgi:hypothetical protein
MRSGVGKSRVIAADAFMVKECRHAPDHRADKQHRNRHNAHIATDHGHPVDKADVDEEEKQAERANGRTICFHLRSLLTGVDVKALDDIPG